MGSSVQASLTSLASKGDHGLVDLQWTRKYDECRVTRVERLCKPLPEHHKTKRVATVLIGGSILGAGLLISGEMAKGTILGGVALSAGGAIVSGAIASEQYHYALYLEVE